MGVWSGWAINRVTWMITPGYQAPSGSCTSPPPIRPGRAGRVCSTGVSWSCSTGTGNSVMHLPAVQTILQSTFTSTGSCRRLSLRATISDMIGDRPQHYVSLLQAMGKQAPRSGQVIAKGHGMAPLRPTRAAAQWQVLIRLDEDWHVNASRVFDESLVPTQVLDDGQVRDVGYPKGNSLVTEFAGEPVNVYGDPVMIAVVTDAGTDPLSVELKLQACSSHICLLPEKIRLRSYGSAWRRDLSCE